MLHSLSVRSGKIERGRDDGEVNRHKQAATMESEMAAETLSAMAAVTASATAAEMPNATVAETALGDCNGQWSRAADGSYSGNSNNGSKTAQPWQSDGVNNGVNNGISNQCR